jgi:multiple sugar transport system permease protein
MRKRLGKVSLGWYILLAIFLVVTLFPIYWMLVTSLKSFQEVYSIIPTFWPKKLMWENYLQIFSKYDYGRALANSAEVSFVVALISVTIALFSAYSVVRLRFRGNKAMPQIFLLSYLIPQTILFIPVYIFLSSVRLADSVSGLILIYTTMTVPYATWVLITHFQNLPIELEEAAFVDGATRMQTILRILIPPSLPSIASTFIFSFTICWSEYIYALVVISTKSQRTITLALSNMLVADIIPWGPLMAGAVIAAVPIMIIYMAASKYIVGGLTLGSVKG